MSLVVTRRTAGAAALLGLVAACSGEGDPAAEPSPEASPSPSGSATPSPTPSPSPTASAAATPDLPPVDNRISLAALMREKFEGGRVRRGRQVLDTGAYTRWEVSYPSGETTVSGVLLRPSGRGPFPAIVLNHGYIEPSVYVTGQGLMREQDALARAGFVVLHTDYRGHAGSDPATDVSRETRLGYTRDTLNAAASLKRLPYVDPERVAMLGRSMGGGVTLNALVVDPGAVKAGVVYASVSSAFIDNFRRWTIRERPDNAQQFYARFGTPAEEPEFYAGLSARTFFSRISEPVLLHHGTNDESCPIRWSRTSQRLLADAGVASRLRIYEGEQHAFGPQWPLSMDRTIGFLRRQLRA